MKKVKRWKGKGHGLLMGQETFPLGIFRLKWKWNYWSEKPSAPPHPNLHPHSNFHGHHGDSHSHSSSGPGPGSGTGPGPGPGPGLGCALLLARPRKHCSLLILLCVSVIACGLYYATYFHVVTTSWHWQWQEAGGGGQAPRRAQLTPSTETRKILTKEGEGGGGGGARARPRPVSTNFNQEDDSSGSGSGSGDAAPRPHPSPNAPKHPNFLSHRLSPDEMDGDGLRLMRGNESFINSLRLSHPRGSADHEKISKMHPLNYSIRENPKERLGDDGDGADAEDNSDQVTSCSLPRLNPMDESIIEFIKTPPDILCTSNSHPMIFRTNFHSTLIQMPQYHQFNLECCYKTFTRGNFSDKEIKFSRDCFRVTRTEQMIPVEHEFIYIRCKNVTLTPINHTKPSSATNGNGNGNGNVDINSKNLKDGDGDGEEVVELINFKDIFAFVPLKDEVEARVASYHAFQNEWRRRENQESQENQETENGKSRKIELSKLMPASRSGQNTNSASKSNNENNSEKKSNERTGKRKKKTIISKTGARTSTKKEMEEEGLSVLILGLDAQSHMNFQRQMPLTRKYLVQDLNAVSLDGYTKVSDNTFPNLVPILTGLNVSELQKICWLTKNSYFDDCPFIWKEFSKRGYRTSFAEDSVWMGTFNYNKAGFLKPPTDYYLHPTSHLMAKTIGHEISGNSELCYGSRLSFEVLLEYIVKTAVTFGQTKRYFQFVWATSLFHDFLNNPKLGDELLVMTIQFLHRHGFLNQTVFLLLSDHGIRWGGIRKTYQGKIEERMPLAYFTFPPWFRSQYPELIRNLKLNSKRLTTPFDIHQVLKDILYFPKMKYYRNRRRRKEEKKQSFSKSSQYQHQPQPQQLNQTNRNRGDSSSSSSRNYNNNNSHNHTNSSHADVNMSNEKRYSRGISLFEPIPTSRSCEDAEISEHWCVCNAMEVILNPSNSTVVRLAATFIVQEINSMLRGLEDYCAKLELSQINEAMKTIEDKFEAPLQTTSSTITTATMTTRPRPRPRRTATSTTTTKTRATPKPTSKIMIPIRTTSPTAAVTTHYPASVSVSSASASLIFLARTAVGPSRGRSHNGSRNSAHYYYPSLPDGVVVVGKNGSPHKRKITPGEATENSSSAQSPRIIRNSTNEKKNNKGDEAGESNSNNNNAVVTEDGSRSNSNSSPRKIQLQVTLVTQPGGGTFEGTVTGLEVKRFNDHQTLNTTVISSFFRNINKYSNKNEMTVTRASSHPHPHPHPHHDYVWEWKWELSGEISRISQYGSQSACISNFILQKFCYCTITAEESDSK